MSGPGRPERRLTTLKEAAASIPDGALLTFGGFDINRAPMALAMELARQDRRGLRLVGVPNPLAFDLLAGAGATNDVEFGFIGFQFEGGFAIAPNLRRAIEGGSIAWKERDVYEIVQGLRASALGLPFLPAPGIEGSDYAKVNRTPRARDSATGEEGPIARPIAPDVALLHAQEADPSGNLRLDDPYADVLQAQASGRVIATAERIVERVEGPTIPRDRVDRVVELPGGAFPTSCHRHHPYGARHLATYLALGAEGRFDEYLERYVRRPRHHAAFLEAAGGLDGSRRPATGRSDQAAATTEPGRREAIDRLVVGMARAIEDGETVTTGLASALPMLAVALAKATRAPRATYINCVGAVNPRVDRASFTSVDVRLLDGCESRVALPELFDRARRGAIDVMFFGAAQLDREAKANLSCLGDYARPRVKLPGPAGSSSMRAFVRRAIFFMPRHSTRTLVPRVDFASSTPSPRNLETLVVTDRALLRLEGGGLTLVSRHRGTSIEDLRGATGFPLEGSLEAVTAEPGVEELKALQGLDPDGIRYSLA
jgi:glutaconate CoA-transferase, subunit A